MNEFEERKSINLGPILTVIIIIMIIGIIIFAATSFKTKPECGNGICEKGENWSTCCDDCGCPRGYECINNRCMKIKPASFCGDGKCDTDENCYNCPRDCKCGEGEYCSKEGKCMKPICGNGICEPFESSNNCCLDCPCPLEGQFCNITSKKCEYPPINISVERAIEIARDYVKENGLDYGNFSFFGANWFNGTMIMIIRSCSISECMYIGVTSSGKAFEVPIVN